MNVPHCPNCRSEIGEEQRVCGSCGYVNWYTCEYCDVKVANIFSIAMHEIECDEKPPEGNIFDC
jgi:hypothetical protein